MGSSIANAGNAVARPFDQAGHATTRAFNGTVGGNRHQVEQNLGRNLEANVLGGPVVGIAAETGHFAPGQRHDPIFGGEKRHAVEVAGKTEADQLAGQQANQAALTSQANAQYGVGQSPQALANAQSIGNYQQQIGQDTTQQGVQSADARYQQGLSTAKQNLARAGLIGSGVQGQDMADLQTQYQAGVLGAQNQGQQAQQQFQNQNTDARLGLVNQITNNGITDVSGLQTAISGLQAQGSGANALGQGIGNALPIAAGAYSNNQLAQAYAR